MFITNSGRQKALLERGYPLGEPVAVEFGAHSK